MRLQHPRRRAGFTLVELLVAAGLTLLIMAILSTAFQVGLDSLRLLKATGDLADRLRTAETLLRQDLDAPHFDAGVSPAGSPQTASSSNPGTLLLSQLRLDLDPTIRPAGGFLQIRQAAPSTTNFEGMDQDQLSSTRATAAEGHGISFTVRRTGKSPGDLFAAVDANMNAVLAQPANQTDVAVAGNTYMTEWAEVHWFLDVTRPTTVNGVPTFPLCRRVRLLTTTPIGGAVPGTSLAGVVSADPSGNTNTLASIANPSNRLQEAVNPSLLPTDLGFGVPSRAFFPVLLSAPTVADPHYGDDIVITNVVSFEVKPTWEPRVGTPSPRTIIPLPSPPFPTGSTAFNADFPFDDLPPVAAPQGPITAFDTALGGFVPTTGSPLPARITGVQIKIRVYDGKSKLTRQSVVTSKL